MNKKLAILLWDFSLGGLQNRMQYLVEHQSIIENKLEVFVILFEKKFPERSLLKSKYIKKVYFPGYESFKLGKWISKLPLGKFFLRCLWLFRFLIDKRLTHVLSYSNQLSLVASLAIIFSRLFLNYKIKFVIAEAILLSNHIRFKQRWFWKYLSRFPYFFVSQVIVATEIEKDDLAENFGVSLKKIKVIRNWIQL
jgi:hypothetical protein